ncbi:hypothetical protein FRACYDRAFT_250889 [Fragilariopsis cylindrus CCMP1102]|uniref:Uncharacterized protein n=1 Tax=Fragilariopsis cylindrus CCMP1102 TaxID=635003 RepID=A0A1E7ENE0_9STRA|nr:hypothetical protein FRACYDRAFT_250889 [Fragilariopsis cylindrus CCMP1102]|eukprot:OEU07472.1 hypothetical protein FRACYDRAFT_250889 [Fragilariopsis cylindrus CCMP1102]
MEQQRLANNSSWQKKGQVTSQIIPPTNPGAYSGTTHNVLEILKAKQLAWKRYKLAQAATKKMIMHAFKDYHFLEFQDDNDIGDIAGYTAIELFERCGRSGDVTALHKLLEQDFNQNEEPQMYYKADK